MNSVTGSLHQLDHVDRIDPVVLLKRRVVAPFAILLAWQERARQRQRLRDLDDHLLADIGIDRGQALAAAGRPFWQD